MKVFKGEVISTKMEKTATVLVERVVKHPVYKKRYTQSKKYHVHDPYGVEVGQTVEFVTSKPYSKLKKWIITTIDGEDKGNSSSNKKSKKTTKSKKSSNSNNKSKKGKKGKEKSA